MHPTAQELHSEDFVNIWFHESTKTLEMEWLDYVSSYKFTPTLDLALQLAVEHNARHWLANRVQMRSLNEADQEWLTKKWLPKFLASGFKKMAVVEDSRSLHRVFEDQVLQSPSGATAEIKCFPTRALALQWINED